MERQPQFYIDQPPELSRSIEEKVERSFSEIFPQDAQPAPLPPIIVFPNAMLRFQKIKEHYNMPLRFSGSEAIELNRGFIDFQEEDKSKIITVDLSTFLSRGKPTFYTGTLNGFYAHDPLIIGRNSRDYPFNIIGIQVKELEKNMSKLSAIWHENGHVYIFQNNLDTQLIIASITSYRNTPKVAQAFRYIELLAKTITEEEKDAIKDKSFDRHDLSQLEGRNYHVEKLVSLFHERNAWAAGAWMMLMKKLPSGFKDSSSYFEYARLCLETYARFYHNDKFVKGWK